VEVPAISLPLFYGSSELAS